MAKVLVVDDENDMRKLICTHLLHLGLTVLEAADGATALTKARADEPDLIILDVMLPGMSGFEVCRTLRSEHTTSRIPVLIVTARADEIDRIVGLELGAEDYVVKPFSPRELMLRVQTVLRRGRSNEDYALVDGSILLDRSRHRAEINGEIINLTATEFKLLTILVEGSGRIQARAHLLGQIRGEATPGDSRTIDTHIRRLREKLGSLAPRIETVRGFGYRWHRSATSRGKRV